MSRSETGRILLISSCPKWRAAVEAGLRDESSISLSGPRFTLYAISGDLLHPTKIAEAGLRRGETVDAVVIDASEAIGTESLRSLVEGTCRIGVPTFVVVYGQNASGKASLFEQIPDDRRLTIPRSLPPELFREMVHSATESGRLRLVLRNQEKTTRQLDRKAAEIARRSEALERWKREFLANVSHELRTPLNAILGYSRLLLKAEIAEQHHRQVEEIHGAGSILLDQINNIIDFAKLSGGEIRLSKIPFRVRDVAAELVEHYRPAAEHKGLRLECHVPPDVPTHLRGDRHRYRQVLASLLSNAVKFTVRGVIDIRLAVDETSSDKVTIRTMVTDTGVGIASDRQEAVFREFSQGDGSSTRSFGGMGLGLAVAKRLVDLMGGQIGFRSGLADGTSFWVALPFSHGTWAKRETGVRQPGQFHCGSCEGGEGETRRRRILAIDSDSTQRVLLDAFLSRTGCLVDAVNALDDGITAARGLSYDLAFLEISGTSKAGLEGVCRLRDAFRRQQRQTPIVVLACTADESDRQAVLDAGADDVLPRPFEVPDLIETVQRHLPLPAKPIMEAEAAIERANDPDSEDEATTWLRHLNELKQAFAKADFSCLESCTGALRRNALRRGSRKTADGAMRLQLAVRSRDDKRISLAMERLNQILGTGQDASPLAELQLC